MSSNFDIVLLAGLFPPEMAAEIQAQSIGPVQSAADALQWSLVDALDQNNFSPVKILNSIYVGSYPRRYRRMMIPTFRFSHVPSSDDVNVGFCNVTLLKHFSRYWSLRPYLRKWLEDTGSGDKVLVAYALTGTFIKCLEYAKKLNPQVQTCVVVPDLPQYMRTTKVRQPGYVILKRLEIRSIMRGLRCVDKYVLLTEHMKRALGIHAGFAVVEGIANVTDVATPVVADRSGLKTIVYSGGLNEQYGVRNLVAAFEGIDDPAFRLVLCGAGDYERDIEEAAKRDGRIAFMGQLPRRDVLRLQESATVLVNPRQNHGEYTKFSFPSKTMEYLASGRPVVAYKLDGIPDDYDGFLFYVAGDTIADLRQRLIEVCEMDAGDAVRRGRRAREFLLTRKSAAAQGGRILSLFDCANED